MVEMCPMTKVCANFAAGGLLPLLTMTISITMAITITMVCSNLAMGDYGDE